MNRHLIRSLLVVFSLLGGVFCGSLFRGTTAQDATPEPIAEEIVGSWIVTGTGEDFSFVNFTSIVPGGVVINTADDGPAGHGAWKRSDEGSYLLTFVVPDFDDDGSLEGMVTVRAEATLGADGATFSGPFAAEVTDPTGAVAFAYGGTVEATRIVVQPLPASSPTP